MLGLWSGLGLELGLWSGLGLAQGLTLGQGLGLVGLACPAAAAKSPRPAAPPAPASSRLG